MLGAALPLLVLVAAAGAESRTFTAHLSGDDEVPPRDTRATGQAVLKLNDSESSLGFRLMVANIDNVRAAHIHCAEPGVNGPVGVTLFAAGGTGPSNGVLATGQTSAPDAGNGCGWTSLADAVNAMESGAAYVNVHTNDGVGPTNTGPGDFPTGESRGRVR